MPSPDAVTGTGVDLGDIPSWLGFLLASASLFWQWCSHKRGLECDRTSVKLSRLSALEGTVSSVRSLAMTYWMQPDSESAQDGLMLIQQLRSLSRDTTKYRDLLWPEAQRDVIALKIQATGSSFQQADRAVYGPTDPFIRALMDKASAFSAKLKDAKDLIEDT